MTRWILATALLAAVLLAACGDDDGPSAPQENGAGEATDPATDDSGATSLPSTETPIANVCEPNPAPGTPETIHVDSPTPLTKHKAKVTVTGKIAVSGGTFKVRIYDRNGAVISGATGSVAQGQGLSPFSQEVLAAVAEEQPACIWVYEESAQDGSPVNVAQVPVVIQP